MTDSPSPAAVPTSVALHCKGVLFDMDGILISSLGSVERSWSAWAISRGIDPALAIRTAHGSRAIETVRQLRPDLDDKAELQAIEDLEMADDEGLAVLPGVMSLLSALHGQRWTVVTSATRRLARRRMTVGGVTVPPRFVTADEVTLGKPNPEPYLRGAAILGVPPSECVVFEDSPSGARAGHAAGCKVISTTFSHSIAQLDGADYHVSDLTGIEVEVLPEDQGLILRFSPLAI